MGKEGREGTFLTLTAAPVYFTMALTGVVGGFLLENYYPANPDAEHPKKPNYIWGTIIALSATSVILLYIFRDYFDYKEEKLKSEGDVGSQLGSNADAVSERSNLKNGLKNGVAKRTISV